MCINDLKCMFYKHFTNKIHWTKGISIALLEYIWHVLKLET